MAGLTEDMVRANTAEAALNHLDTLPTLAPVALELLQLTWSQDSDARDIVARLRGDQSLAARVLAVANSALLCGREPITSLEQAVVRLGFRLLRNIVLAVKVFDAFPPDAPGSENREFQRIEFWRHALGVACAARALAARHSGGLDRDQAFLAGLLHDIGKVALDAVFPKAYERAVRSAERQRGDLAEFEQAQIGISHTLAGRRLAERWKLPDFLRETIWLHHFAPESLPSQTAHADLVALVRLADTLVREHRIGFSGNHAAGEPALDLALRLGLAESDLTAVAEGLVAEVAEYSNLLGLDRETPAALYVKSLMRANGELSRLNSDLLASNQRLTVAARYFRALTQFEQHLNARSTLGELVQAAAEAARIVLQQPAVAAVATDLRTGTLELALATDSREPRGTYAERISPELESWLAEPHPAPLVQPAPLALRSALHAHAACLGPGEWWLLPLTCHQERLGAIVFAGEADPRKTLLGESDELRGWLASVAVAVGRTLAHASAQRLSDDLAETNRRLQQAQAEVLRNRTLAMIAEMATGAGHELNNPLAVISGRAQMLLDQNADPQQRKSLEMIATKAHECSSIVTDLMSFAQPPKPQFQSVHLLELLGEIRSGWLPESGLGPERCDLRPAHAAAGGPRVRVDPGQIRQALVELLRNAAYAIEANQGRITIAWRELQDAPRPGAAGPGAWVEVVVRDTGAGMTAAAAQRAFTPFYSSRPAGRGRGLGLPRAYRLIEANGGRVWIESKPNLGASVFVLLPQG